MARMRLLLLVLVVLAVAIPSGASTQDVGCSQGIHSGGTASCVLPFHLPHFTPDDAIDYDTLIARISAPQANDWKVHAKISDAKGKVYFAWECSVGRSMNAGAYSASLDRSCSAWRKLVYKKHHGEKTLTYYTADTSKPQILTVTAWVGTCPAGCRFEAAATYLLAG